MFKLNHLKPAAGSKDAPKRKGKGVGSGLGKTAGRGHKGQRARSGGRVHNAFEGGQVPIPRRMPKVGFSSALKKNRIEVNTANLGQWSSKTVVLKDLLPSTHKSKSRAYVSVVGIRLSEKLPKSIEAHKFAPLAKKLLEAAGVKLLAVEYKDGSFSTRSA